MSRHDGPTPPAERRLPMPPRTCQGFRRSCSTRLARDNQDPFCSACLHLRGDAIIADANEYSRNRHAQDRCSRGHEWSPANTLRKSDGSRRCRECIVLGRGGRAA